MPELNANVSTKEMLLLPPINYKGGGGDGDGGDDNDTDKDDDAWCVDFPTSGWSQFCTLWKRMILQLYRNKVQHRIFRILRLS